jgi:hypothetical protein
MGASMWRHKISAKVLISSGGALKEVKSMIVWHQNVWLQIRLDMGPNIAQKEKFDALA